MLNKKMNTKKINRLIKLHILIHKKKIISNSLTDYYIMFDKNGKITILLNYLLFERINFNKRYFELNSVDIINGKIKFNKVSCCEIIEYTNHFNPKIYINFIGTAEKDCIGKGYNYMILRAVEQFALENNTKKLYGLYMPMYPGTDKTARKFYERNQFTHYFEQSSKYPEDMIEKMRVDFRNMSFNNVNGIKTASDVFEKEENETDINN